MKKRRKEKLQKNFATLCVAKLDCAIKKQFLLRTFIQFHGEIEKIFRLAVSVGKSNRNEIGELVVSSNRTGVRDNEISISPILYVAFSLRNPTTFCVFNFIYILDCVLYDRKSINKLMARKYNMFLLFLFCSLIFFDSLFNLVISIALLLFYSTIFYSTLLLFYFIISLLIKCLIVIR